jgi:hypothetical protein
MRVNRRRVIVLVLSGLFLAGCAAVAAWLLLRDGVGVHETEMALTKVRLGTLSRAFDSVGDPPNGRGRPAKVRGCSTDSGDLFQPYAHREWQVSTEQADAVALEVVRRLLELGWRNAPELSLNSHPDYPVPSEPLTADRFGNYTLRFEANGWSATGTVGPSFEKVLVLVSATISDAMPCFWKR